MALIYSPGLAADALNAMKTALDGGRLYYFAGPVPANANDALDMATLHTELVAISDDGGVGGLTFTTATAAQLNKTTAQVWKGVVNFDGFDAASSTLTPTFFRYCPAGDNGRGAGSPTSKRVQGLISGPTGAGDLVLASDTLTDNGTNEESVTAFFIRALING